MHRHGRYGDIAQWQNDLCLSPQLNSSLKDYIPAVEYLSFLHSVDKLQAHLKIVRGHDITLCRYEAYRRYVEGGDCCRYISTKVLIRGCN